LTLPGHATPLYPLEAEFGQPLWQLGMRTYVPLADGRVLATFFQQGRWYMVVIDRAGQRQPIDLPVSVIHIVNGSDQSDCIYWQFTYNSDHAVSP
jgi:hypothetical protein